MVSQQKNTFGAQGFLSNNDIKEEMEEDDIDEY